MRGSVVLLLAKVDDALVLLSMARGKSDLTRYERFARRQNRREYLLHVSTADLQPA